RNHPVDVMILELNGLRMIANAEFNVVRRATASAIVTRIGQLITGGSDIAQIVNNLLDKLLLLFKRMIFETADQADFLMWIQKDLVGRDKNTVIMQTIGMKLYNEDLFDDDGILKWWNDGKGPEGETPGMKVVREGAKQFVMWVKEQTEEES